MWPRRSTQKYRIYKFTCPFVIEILEWASKNQGIHNQSDIQNTMMSPRLRTLVEYSRYRVFKNHMLTLSNCDEIRKVYHAYKFFSKNYKKIISGRIKKYPRLTKSTISTIAPVFKYFYEDLIDNEFFWSVYNPGKAFLPKTEIRAMVNENNTVCPYCDLVDINANETNNMDHFLPKSDFPYLAIFWGNFVLACSICNGIQIKHWKWFIPSLHPYLDNINEMIKFNFEIKSKKIILKTKRRVRGEGAVRTRGNNLIKLLKYNSRYAGLWKYVCFENNELQTAVKLHYHENKYSDKGIHRIFEEAVNLRKSIHNSNAGKLTHTKLKLDYCNFYLKKGDVDLLDFFDYERKRMLSRIT